MKPKPSRSATRTTVKELVPYSGYPLEPSREEMHVGGLGELLAITAEWNALPLGYRFEGGKFGNTPMEAQYWARWRSSRQVARRDKQEESR